AIDWVQRDGVRAGRGHPRLRVRIQGLPATGLTGLGAADLEAHGGRRLAPEMTVETDHAVNLGARTLDARGDLRHGVVGYIADRVLDRMQDRQQRAFLPSMPQQDGAHYVSGVLRIRRSHVPGSIHGSSPGASTATGAP